MTNNFKKTIPDAAMMRKAVTMGVATYKTADEMPENLRKALPDIEELKKLI